MGDQCNMDFERVSSEALVEVLKGKVKHGSSCLAWPGPHLRASPGWENSKSLGSSLGSSMAYAVDFGPRVTCHTVI